MPIPLRLWLIRTHHQVWEVLTSGRVKQELGWTRTSSLNVKCMAKAGMGPRRALSLLP